ncbi:protein FAM83A [Heterodontus francisci]|uniref:protein FAM83A n=1 Tax=Heterodontus francisci TaxID=7792 RepID=UPI00355B0162
MNAQSYLRTNYQLKPAGKMKKRLEAIKNPWIPPPTFDLSHNESIRLATDTLLDIGAEAYDNVLTQEGEVNFLSPSEIRYIISNAKEPLQLVEPPLEGEQTKRGASDASADPSDTYFPALSDSNGPVLEQGWPMADKRYYLKGPSNINVYFQTAKSDSIKDVLRFYISQAIELLAIVMDVFTDIDIFCDVLEAANKRNVTVYLLLDQHSLQYFTEMCEKLQIKSSHLKNIGVRHVSGDLYCSKSGKKFSGQVQEKFIIIDCLYVLAGSYSFTWLSGQVHRNFITLFSGHIVECFDEEFRRLYSQSKPVNEFSSTQLAPRSPPGCLSKTSTRSIRMWPESRNTRSDSLSGVSNYSEQRHNVATPQHRVLYSSLLQQRNYPFLVTGVERLCPGPVDRYLNEIPKPLMYSKDINVLRPQREELQNISRLLPFGQNYLLRDTKHWLNPEQTNKGKYSMDFLFRPNNLTNPNNFNNRYEKYLKH